MTGWEYIMVGGFIIPIEPICGGCSKLNINFRGVSSEHKQHNHIILNLSDLSVDENRILIFID